MCWKSGSKSAVSPFAREKQATHLLSWPDLHPSLKLSIVLEVLNVFLSSSRECEYIEIHNASIEPAERLQTLWRYDRPTVDHR